MRAPPATPLETDPGAAATAEPTVPFPPRFWWFKRLLLAGLLMLLGVGGLRLWWGWRSHQLLQAYVSDLKSRGEPVTVDDLNPPADIPVSDNAALPLLQAAGMINPNSGSGPSNSQVTFPTAWPFDATWDQMAGQAVAAHANLFPLVRQARSRTRADFGIRAKTPGVSVLLPQLNALRTTANLVSDAALWAHFQGDDAAAIETIRDVRAIGPTAEAPAVLVGHLVHIGIDALALYKLQVMAPELTVAPDDDTDAAQAPFPTAGPNAPRRPASRRQVRELITELLNDSDRDDGLRRPMGGERVLEIDTTQWATRNLWLLRPMFELDILRMTRHTDGLAQAATQPDWPTASAAPPMTPVAPSVGTSPATVMSAVLMFSGTRAVQQDFRARAERRMAAVALAVRLYRLDHAGQWPASLGELVPDYLPSVPLDPFSPGGNKPLGYVILTGALPDGSDRPLVYHVDENGRDDTAGKPAPPVPAVPCYTWTPKVPDQWRDLKRWMPPSPATTQPTTAPSPGGA